MKRTVTLAWTTALILVTAPTFPEGVVDQCKACHGDTGISDDPAIPMIAGFSDFAILDLLDSYRSGLRPERELELPDGTTTSMVAIAESLSPAEIDEVASFFSAQIWVPQRQAFDENLASRGRLIHEVKCSKCHSDGGAEPDDDLAVLAGQWREYLTHQIADFDAGTRRMADKMKEKYDTLSAADKGALVEYYVGGLP